MNQKNIEISIVKKKKTPNKQRANLLKKTYMHTKSIEGDP